MKPTSPVPRGYKRTKVGVIPEEWEVVKLGSIAKIETGKTPLRSKNAFWDNAVIPWATTTEVNEKYITSTKEKVSKAAVEDLKMKIFPENTILLAMYGQGKTRGKVGLLKIKSTINQAFAAIQPSDNYITGFVFNYLDKSYMIIRELSHGSNQDNLNLDIVKSISIPYPPLEEQQKIAQILSTWDEAIVKLEALIEEKERFKKGLMQKLLSAKLRFPGFEGEWEEVRLGNVAFKKPSSISANSIENNSGNYIIYGATGVLKKIDFYTEKDPYISIVKDGAGVGRVFLCNPYTSVLGTMDIIKPKSSVSLYFLFSLLQQFNFIKYVTGSTIPHIYFKDYSKVKIKLPSKQEQQKIVRLLITLDKEIDLLKKELETLKEQKQGLMQKLLTGEVRVKT